MDNIHDKIQMICFDCNANYNTKNILENCPHCNSLNVDINKNELATKVQATLLYAMRYTIQEMRKNKKR